MNPVQRYLESVRQKQATGRATEHTHRAALERLFEEMFSGQGVSAINDPKHTEYGAVDFWVLDRRRLPIGHVETKRVGENLDRVERSEQMERYQRGYPSLVLTDYLEFRWYVRGERRAMARLGGLGRGGEVGERGGGAAELTALLHSFVAHRPPPVASGRELAARLAFFAGVMRGVVLEALRREYRGEAPRALADQLKSFQEVLLADFGPDLFADLYAQTLCYGLFAARLSLEASRPTLETNEPDRENAALFGLEDSPGLFARQFNALTALRNIRNPLLRTLFGQLGVMNPHPDLEWVIADVVGLLSVVDVAGIRREFGRNSRRTDPVLHFYEDFLAAYNPRLREARGVYYTPEPVVDYMVRSVDELLKTRFSLPGGLADKATLEIEEDGERRSVPRVQVLDPATGTGTFLRGVIEHVYEGFKNNQGRWPAFVKQHLLPRLHGFEFLVAPYAVAHMKLEVELATREPPVVLTGDERFSVWLTNTLEEPRDFAGSLPFAQELLREAQSAGRVKGEAPVMVVLGNPPYSGHSANDNDKNAWINRLLRGYDTKTGREAGSYFAVDGRPLGEQNPKWLNDDYVKFVRFAQWRIEQTGSGVLAFVTNHGYLDNPTFRGMRRSLMETFDELYLLDLHGNVRKKETAPDGSRDENVFDIQQGVAIGLFVKLPPGGLTLGPRVFHADLWGPREVREGRGEESRVVGGKYHWLDHHSLESTPWRELQPAAPLYLFTPRDADLEREYSAGWKITDAMPVNSAGIVTARDSLTIHWTQDEAWRTVKDFLGRGPEEAREFYDLGPDARDWKVALAQKDLRESGPSKVKLSPVLYRPFDTRYTYYTGHSRGFHCMPRGEVMRHMVGRQNVGLIATRQTRDQWDVLAAGSLIGHKALAAFDINTLFPLYLYPAEGEMLTAEAYNAQGRRANLAPGFVAEFAEKLGLAWLDDGAGDRATSFGPEDVFHYVYGLLHSPAYRARYAGFLKTDFPRVPVTSQLNQFVGLTKVGAKLAGLHTMERRGPETAGFHVAGPNLIERVAFYLEGDAGRVYINERQYFGPVPPEVWVVSRPVWGLRFACSIGFTFKPSGGSPPRQARAVGPARAWRGFRR